MAERMDLNTAMIAAFFRWWTKELEDLLPVRRKSGPVAGARLVAALGNDGVALFQEAGEPPATVGESLNLSLHDLPVALASLRRRTGALPIGIRVRHGDCFVRTLELPAAAERDFARMLSLDLERTTPLKAADVLAAHIVEGPVSGRRLTRVRHLVLKTRTIAAVQQSIRDAGADVAFIDCLDADGQTALPVDFLAPARRTPARTWTPRRMATAAAVCLAVIAFATYWLRHEWALSNLETEIARREEGASATRRALAQVRDADADVARLRRLEAERHSALVVLDEVTRLVPSTAWVQEFRLDGTTIEITGLAVSAAALLPAFERSDWFHEARFTAPIRIDPGEDRERFRLEVRLRHPPPTIVTR
jgi:general secretion pathway protein L